MYEQDNNTSNGKEKIEWIIHAKKNNRVLLISKYVLDCQPYNMSQEDVTWETCTLRKWLNNDFLNTAFNSDEQRLIETTTVVADKNPYYDTNCGNNTLDKVFLLNITDVNRFTSDETKKCAPTDYAVEQGLDESSNNMTADEGKTCTWWLHTPGYKSIYASYVSSIGVVNYYGDGVQIMSNGVRPAMWISVET